MNNLLYYFEKNYPKNTNNDECIVNNLGIDIKYNDYNNHKYINTIKTNLPISNFMKFMFDNKHLKLDKKVKNKFIKIIYILQYYNMYENIINYIV